MFSLIVIQLLTNFKCVLGFYRLRPIKQLHSSEGKRMWKWLTGTSPETQVYCGKASRIYVKNTHTYCSLKLCWKAFSEMYTSPQSVTVLKNTHKLVKI